MENSEQPKFGTLLEGNTITLAEKTPAHQAVYLCAIIIYIINLVLSTISFTFGTISWFLLSKWRSFQNYVFLNLIITSSVNMIGFNVCAHYKFSPIVVVLLLLVPRVIMSHWLLVTISMFYLNIVKVYNTEVSRRYLKVNTFCWIVPFVEVLTIYAIEHFLQIRIVVNFNYGVNIIILVVTFILYVSVLYSIIKSALAQRGTWRDIGKKMLIAYGFSIPSGISSLFPVLVMEVMHTDMVMYNVGLIICLLTITVGNIGFLCLRRHRVMWVEYKRRRRAINNVYKPQMSSPTSNTGV